MAVSVLVAYATRYSSTEEVADAVATTLCEGGLATDMQPMREVCALKGYDAIVLGAPLYMLHWHKDALQFLERHHIALASRPVAVFALGPLHDDETEFAQAREQLERELAGFPWLAPKAITIFGGKFDPEKLAFPYNLLSALRNMPPSDVRDWAVIRDWASVLAVRLQPASPTVGAFAPAQSRRG